MKEFCLAFLVTMILFSCETKKSKKILYRGDLIAGAIIKGKDTILNGRIVYYDTATKMITEVRNYRNNKLNGLLTSYYQNGSKKRSENYVNGDENGYSLLYDSLGKIYQKSYYFHGVLFGPLITFQNDQPSRYSFYSFDGYQLMYLKYNSFIRDSILALDDIFFYNAGIVFINESTGKQYRNCFIYLPSPPNFRFKYTFCKVNKFDSFLEEIKVFDSEKVWDTFELPEKEIEDGKYFALRLEIFENDQIIQTLTKKL